MELGHDKDNKSLQFCAFSVLPLVSDQFLSFSQLVFLFRDVVCVAISMLDPECVFHYLRDPCQHHFLFFFGPFGVGSEGRAGASSEEEPFVPSAVQQSQSLHQELQQLPPAALWRCPTSELVLGMPVICDIWLVSQCQPSQIMWSGAGKAPSRWSLFSHWQFWCRKHPSASLVGGSCAVSVKFQCSWLVDFVVVVVFIFSPRKPTGSLVWCCVGFQGHNV